MSAFAVAFLASLVGGVVATGVIALLDRYFPAPTQSFVAEPVVRFPNPLRLRAAAFLVLAAWLCLVAFVVCAAVGAFVGSATLIFGSLGLFVGCVSAYVAIALTLRCTKCQKHVTIQWVTEPRFRDPVLGMDGWASVIMNVVLKRQFRCMYCGQRFVVAGAGV